MSDVTGIKMRTRACAAMAVLALSASACGGADGAATTARATADTTTTTVVVEDRAASTTAAASAAVDAPTAAVLAYAIESAESLSYSFEQGMSIDLNMLGQTLNASSNGPMVTGVISGENQQISIDLSGFMESMIDSTGVDPSNELAEAGISDLDAFSMNAWVVDRTLVIDVSGLASQAVDSDPSLAEQFALFAEGPVSVDLDQLTALGVEGDLAPADLIGQFSDAAQVVDPTAIVDALRSVDSLNEVGNQEENGVEVTVYEANITLAEYTAALGQTIEDGAGGFGSFGGFDPTAFAPLLTDVEVGLQISLDGEGLVRQIVTTIDMGAFIEGMLSSGAEADDASDLTMVVEMWQTFDNYGDDVEITAPVAPDATAEIAVLLGS